jgi:hypothetical protein
MTSDNSIYLVSVPESQIRFCYFLKYFIYSVFITTTALGTNEISITNNEYLPNKLRSIKTYCLLQKSLIQPVKVLSSV